MRPSIIRWSVDASKNLECDVPRVYLNDLLAICCLNALPNFLI